MTSDRVTPRRQRGELRRPLRTLLACALVVHSQLLAPIAWAADLPVSCAASACAGGLSQFATGGAATLTPGDHSLTIDQTTDRAILNWRSFDIAAGNSVRFRQPSESAVALNRIHDGAPSRILGRLDANGQVYLLNPNGVVFGGGSQVNVNGIVATSLDVSDDVFNGVGIAQAIGQSNAPALTATGARGAVSVQQGARITAAKGGRILLAAPEVNNAGSLRADEGQVLLVAARDRVFIQPSSSSNLRGFLIGVGDGGTAVNDGDILVPRGNATLIGAAVNQNGRVSASTSVQLNGSVRLVAQQGATVQVRNGRPTVVPLRAGNVTLGSASLTEVLPELSATAAVVDDQPQPFSSIEIGGANVDIQGGARVRAPSGNLSVLASSGFTTDVPAGTRAGNRLRVGAGAVLDVSGVDSVVLPQSRNLVKVDLRANELADSPLQRAGVLRGDSIVVDARLGSDVALVDATIATVQRTVGERLSVGGTLSLVSGGDVVVAPGALLDVSGGAVRFEAGALSTTQLVSDGRIVDIATADPNLSYQGIVRPYTKRHGRWGVTETFDGFVSNPVGEFAAGYLEGKDAGSLLLRARGGVFEGQFDGSVQAGFFQRAAPGGVGGLARPFDERPLAGTFTLDLAFDEGVAARNVAIATSAGALSSLDLLPDDHAFTFAEVMLEASGFGTLDIATNGVFSVAAGVALDLSGGETLRVEATGASWQGALRAPGATVDISVARVGDPPLASLELGTNAVLDVRGAWVNDNPLLGPFADIAATPLWIDGGSVNLAARGDLTLLRGSLIDVGGGAQLDADGNVHVGRGGDLSLVAGIELGDSLLQVGGALIGASLGAGGTLHIGADQIAVTPGVSLVGGGSNTPPVRGASNYFVVPATGIFDLGFGAYELTASRYDLLVQAGTRIAPVDRRLVLREGFMNVASGTPLRSFAGLQEVPAHLRGPIDVTLAVDHGARLGERRESALIVQRGATIELAPGANLSLETDQRMLIDGTLRARGGNVDLHLTAGNSSFRTNQAIWIGEHAVLDASATFVPVPDDAGLLRANPFDAGTLALRADRGWVLVQRGALLDVSGADAELDIARTDESTAERSYVALDAGTVRVSAGEGFSLQGTMRAAPVAGAFGSARGGTLALTLDAALRNPRGDPNFSVIGDRSIALAESFASDGLTFGGGVGERFAARGELALAGVRAAGFDSLELHVRDLPSTLVVDEFDAFGRIDIGADLALDLRQRLVFDAGRIVLGQDADARFGAAHVSLGNQHTGNGQGAPTQGNGTLRFDVLGGDLNGNLRVDGAGLLRIAARDDLRLIGVRPAEASRQFSGTLGLTGRLELAARQVAPATLSDFTLLAGTIDVAGSGAAPQPLLSAGGSLTLRARDISVSGALKSPGGALRLEATNSLRVAETGLLSVSLGDAAVPFGRTQGGIDWVYPIARDSVLTRLVTEPPQKRIDLLAPSIVLADGSVVDLRGGGDLLASEFIRGPGGTRNLIEPGFTGGSFAILPQVDGLFAPYDILEYSGFDFMPGQSIELAAAPGVAAGTYAIMPARYALLPGALLVTPQEGTLDAVPGAVRQRADGVPLVAGRLVDRAVFGADTAQARSVGSTRFSAFAVETGAQLLQRAEIRSTSANGFFVTAAAARDVAVPQLPRDGGGIAIAAATNLDLSGALLAGAAAMQGARAGVADISAAKLFVTSDPGAAPAGFVALDAASLAALDVGSLLLGGTRSRAGDGTLDLGIAASEVRIDDGLALSLPELLLVANDEVAVGAGAQLDAGGNAGALAPQRVRLGANGALLALSSISDLQVERAPGAAVRGNVSVLAQRGEDGALARRPSLSARSLALDAARDVQFDGLLVPPTTRGAGGAALGFDGTVSFASERVRVGGSDVAGALTLRPDELATAQVRNLSLRVGSALDFLEPADLAFDTLTLATPLVRGVLGADGAGAGVRLRARQVTLRGGADAAVASGDAAGALTLAAERIAFAGGTQRISGFSTVDLRASRDVRAESIGNLLVDAPLSIATPALVTAAGADLGIDSGAFGLSLTGGELASSASSGLGGHLALTGASMVLDTRLLTPAGRIEVASRTGDITLGAHAVLDASGRRVTLASYSTFAAPGSVALASARNLVLATGGRIDVSAAAAASNVAQPEPFSLGGSLDLVAGGAIDADATLAGTRARIRLDAGVLDSAGSAGNDLQRLNARIGAGGFELGRSYRQRDGSLRFDATGAGHADALDIAVDSGQLTLSGRASLGSHARLLARDGIEFLDAAGVDFSAAGRAQLQLGVTDADARIDIGAGGITAAHGLDLAIAWDAGAEAAEVLHLAALPPDSVLTLQPTLRRSEADGVIDAADTARYAGLLRGVQVAPSSRAALLASTGLAEADARVRPDLVVSAAGDLRLSANWSLADAHVDGQPGRVFLRAGGDLTIAADLEDGYLSVFDDIIGFEVERLGTEDSFGFSLVGGADLASVDALAVGPGAGDVRIGSGVRVRTGTGDIDVRAARDVRLGDARSTIFSGGRSTGTGNVNASYASVALPSGEFPEFAEAGGQVRVNAGRDYVGVRSTQLLSEWLVRLGGPLEEGNGAVRPTIYGVVAGRFRQGLGAFGEGGGVSVRAGRDMLDLEAALPQTAQHVGDSARVSQDFFALTFDNAYRLRNPDALEVRAGRDLLGGFLFQGGGRADIRAVGEVGARGTGPGVTLAMNDAAIDVIAGRNLRLEQAFNASVAPVDLGGLQYDFDNVLYFTYGANSRISLTSTAGDVVLGNDATRAFTGRGTNPFAFGTNILPGTLGVAALEGDIALESGMVLFPSPRGGLVLAAAGELQTRPRALNSGVVVTVSDADARLLPSRELAASSSADAALRLPSSGFGASDLLHASVPVHAGDRDPVRLIAAGGDADVRALVLFSAESVRADVARDLLVDQLNVQHANADDVTRIQVGRDFRFLTPRNLETGAIGRSNSRVDVAGAGRLELIAGRNIDLGSGAGIVTSGDLGNAALPDEGARIDLFAAASTMDVTGFVNRYVKDDAGRKDVLTDQLTVFMRRVTGDGKLDAMEAMARFAALPVTAPADVPCVECYKGRQALQSDLRDLDLLITDFMEARTGATDLDPVAARLQFIALSEDEQRPLVADLFFDALGRAGRTNALDSTQRFDAGYLAIETLFPGTLRSEGNVDAFGVIRRPPNMDGQINLFFSRVATNDGGDINLFVPGGSVNVGLSASFAGAKPVSELGIVAQRAGSVRAFVDGDFQINQSRVFALDGGDISLWSTVGNIDAGRGAKSAVSAPPPTISFDSNGNVVVEFPPAISGSGIRTALATVGRDPGDVLLFAPAGAVIASDAPIISAGDVVIAATQIVGSDISAGGVTVGVPVGTDGLASAVAGAADAATQASSDAAATATAATGTGDAPLARAALGWLEVFLEGFDAGMPAPESERRRRG